MYNRRGQNLHKIILGQLFFVFVITAMALSILFYAEGYRFNIKNFKVIKTGVVNVVSYPKDAQVYINNKLVHEKTPYAQNVMPGYYNVDVKKEGFTTWHMSAKIETGLVDNYKNIILIKSVPTISDLKDERKINLLHNPDDSLAVRSNNLYYSDYEIWYDNKLVTRFSSPIQRAFVYPDSKHIVFQQGAEIRIIELTGTNDTLLVKLSSDTPTSFAVNNKGDELYYTDAGQYKMAEIR